MQCCPCACTGLRHSNRRRSSLAISKEDLRALTEAYQAIVQQRPGHGNEETNAHESNALAPANDSAVAASEGGGRGLTRAEFFRFWFGTAEGGSADASPYIIDSSGVEVSAV